MRFFIKNFNPFKQYLNNTNRIMKTNQSNYADPTHVIYYRLYAHMTRLNIKCQQ